MHKTISTYIFYPLILGLFVLDIVIFGLLEKPLLYSLLALFCVEAGYGSSVTRLGFITLLLSFESFLYYGRFGIQIIYLIPLAALGYCLQAFIYKKSIIPPLLLVLALGIQSTFIEPYFFGVAASLGYTFSKIFVSICLLWILSLTYK